MLDSELLKSRYNYEYTFYIKHGKSCPFLQGSYFSMEDVKRAIFEIEKKSNRYNWIYYIDNEFYNNYYHSNIGGTYYKVLKRPVSNWLPYEYIESKNLETYENETNIIDKIKFIY